ncbi:hypothetical protein PGIGA_G00220450 [Pangasianodon gigas]|uniref:Uncharacterized protein n=1 Tax=Pangasianodon gigas TaxID=30993 RepID=A0ACC5WI81_PANGG|nr:hypothetical protein [Pangasianodon gigas]
MLKAVILIGGPQKGTRFRPLSFEVPKPLFPVAGVPMLQHHIEACAKVPNMKEILLIGFYQPNEELNRFLSSAQQEFKIPVRDEQCNGWQRAEVIRLEQDIFTALAAQEKLYVYKTDRFWSQIKSAGSAIYASRLYLNQYHKTHPERLAINKDGGPKIIGNVYIHPTANIDPTAVLGPNVSIGTGVTIGAGVRVRESIILHGATLQDHCCVLNSIIGWDSTIGKWARVEGTPSDPNPNDPYAKIDSETLFRDGKLTPSITILGCNVTIPSEVIILNSIVLPHKDLNRSFKNQIIL